jgi:hypothetical protein
MMFIEEIIRESTFDKFKSLQLSKLSEALTKKEVDIEIIPYLNEINSLEKFVTLWSCIGHEESSSPYGGGGAYLTIATDFSPTYFIEHYHKVANHHLHHSKKGTYFNKCIDLSLGVSEEIPTYVFRFGINSLCYNHKMIETQIQDLIDFLKSLH